jgi:hypothetical protein
MNGPSAEDFDKLNAKMTEYVEMDLDRLNFYQAQFHIELPEPYFAAESQLDMSDPEVLRALHDYLEIDESISSEERYAMSHELSDRHHTAQLAKAPEGWND